MLFKLFYYVMRYQQSNLHLAIPIPFKPSTQTFIHQITSLHMPSKLLLIERFIFPQSNNRIYNLTSHNLHKDMKTYLFDIEDKLLLNKHSLIRSVFSVFKKHLHLQHTRHCSHINFLVHIIVLLLQVILSTNLITLSPLPSLLLHYPILVL